MLIYFFQKIIWLPFVLIVNFFLHFQVEGKKNFKLIKKNQYFIIANHRGFLDACLVLTAIPFFHFLKTNFRCMINPYWLKIYPIAKLLGAYPIYRKQGSLKKTLADTEQFIKNKKGLLIFPEGIFSKNDKPVPAKQGISYLSRKYNLPILPMALFGSEGVNGNKGLNLKKVFLKKCHIKIKIGKPFYYSDVADYSDNNLTAAQKIMERVNAML